VEFLKYTEAPELLNVRSALLRGLTLEENRDTFISRTLQQDPPHAILDFIRYGQPFHVRANQSLGDVGAGEQEGASLTDLTRDLLASLADQQNRKALVGRCLAREYRLHARSTKRGGRPLHVVVGLLAYLEKFPALNRVYDAVINDLCKQDKELVECAFQTALSDWRTFFEYTEKTSINTEEDKSGANSGSLERLVIDELDPENETVG
jgi:hypothetical protein